jgi:hypothetical protein
MRYQSKPHSPSQTRKIHRGRPAFAASQREKILELLRAAGAQGVSRATLIFEHRMTQCGARVDELKRQGCVIESFLLHGETYVRYRLTSEPLELQQPAPIAAGRYERGHGRRPSQTGGLPLFDAAVRS